MLSINYRDPRPIYEQVRDSLQQLILSGAIQPGEKLPSVRELASQLAINPNTIQRAYRELEHLGVIDTVPGKGAFAARDDLAAEHRKQELRETIQNAARELCALGVPEQEIHAMISDACNAPKNHEKEEEGT